MTKHKYLSGAIRAFERAAPPYGECDFWFKYGVEREFRDAPAPFTVEEYSTAETREFEGRLFCTDHEVGVQLLDARGRVWRQAGVYQGGDLVKDAKGRVWIKDHFWRGALICLD
jgi:hypothetical protein